MTAGASVSMLTCKGVRVVVPESAARAGWASARDVARTLATSTVRRAVTTACSRAGGACRSREVTRVRLTSPTTVAGAATRLAAGWLALTRAGIEWRPVPDETEAPAQGSRTMREMQASAVAELLRISPV